MRALLDVANRNLFTVVWLTACLVVVVGYAVADLLR